MQHLLYIIQFHCRRRCCLSYSRNSHGNFKSSLAILFATTYHARVRALRLAHENQSWCTQNPLFTVLLFTAAGSPLAFESSLIAGSFRLFNFFDFSIFYYTNRFLSCLKNDANKVWFRSIKNRFGVLPNHEIVNSGKSVNTILAI